MGYYEDTSVYIASLLAPLDDASGVARNMGWNASAMTAVQSTPGYRAVSSPLGKAIQFGTGWFTSSSGMAAGHGHYTVGAWIRTTSTDATRAYAGNPANCLCGDWTNAVLRGFGVHDGKVELTRYTTGNAWVYTAGTSNVNDDRWHLIAAATTTAGRIRIIVDGVQETEVTPAVEFNSNGSFSAYGGGYTSGVQTAAGDKFDGYAAGLFVTFDELSPANLLSLYRAGLRQLVTY